MRYATGLIECPHAHAYVSPCGQGLLICNSQPQSGLSHVSNVPVVLRAGSIFVLFPLSRSLKRVVRYVGCWQPKPLELIVLTATMMLEPDMESAAISGRRPVRKAAKYFVAPAPAALGALSINDAPLVPGICAPLGVAADRC